MNILKVSQDSYSLKSFPDQMWFNFFIATEFLFTLISKITVLNHSIWKNSAAIFDKIV